MSTLAERAAPARRRRERPVLRVLDGANRASEAVRSRTRSGTSVAERARRDANRLLVVTAALNCFGLVMVLAASSVASITSGGSPWSLFEKQVMWTVIGLVALLGAMRVDLLKVRRYSMPLVIGSALLLLVVLAPGLGTTVGGSSRWIGFGPLRIQPSELAKIAFAVYVADLVARREHLRDLAREIVKPVGIVLGIMGILILKQPDMGTAAVLVCIATSILFAAGIDRRLLTTVMVAIVLAGGIFTMSASYRRERFLSFLHPFANASTSGYQIVQSLVALGSGHLTGTGVGGSVAAWNILPNAWTDFIFAIIGNELGLVGSIAVIAAFVALGVFGVRIATHATDRFSSLLAIGLTCWIIAQAFINIGGVVGLMPETGIPLPFLSSGGSSLVVGFAAIGLLVNVARSTGAARVSAPAAPARRPTASARAGASSTRRDARWPSSGGRASGATRRRAPGPA